MWQPKPFDSAHPSVPALCLCSIVLVGTLVFHPVYEAIFMMGALAGMAAMRGVRASLASLAWSAPMLALVCVANPLFSASGSTELARLGPLVVYAESLAYGLCMGMMLVGSLLWLQLAGEVLTAGKVLATAGRTLPTVSLMASIAAGLVPQLMQKGRGLRSARLACTCSQSRPKFKEELVDESCMLVSWALEDSLERADAMRARGWDSSARRTSYRAYAITERDMLALAGLALLAAASAGLGWVALGQWRFYPTMAHLVVWWGYAPYAVLCAIPALVSLWQRHSMMGGMRHGRSGAAD